MAGEETTSTLKVLVELVDQVTEPLHAIHEQFEEFESSVWSLAQAWGAAFLGAELFEHLTEPAAEFQEQQVKLALATRASAHELAEFKEQASDLASRFPSTIEEITAAQTELYQTFRNTEDMEHATEIAARLGVVLGVDAKQGASILASAYENLGDQSRPVGEEMKYISDKIATLTTLFPAGGGGAARMAQDFARLGASVKTYGININAALAFIAEMNRLHVGGQRGAGMFAQQLIHTLAAVDKNGTPTLAKYGLQIVKFKDGGLNLIKTLEAMKNLSPQALRGLEQHLPGQSQALAQLISHLDDVKTAYGEFVGSAGAAEHASDKLGDTYQANMHKLKNTWSDFLDVFGTLALPALTQMLKSITENIKAMEHWTSTHPVMSKVIANVLLLGAALITLFGVIGAVGKTITFLMEGFELFGPILTGLATTWGVLTAAVTGFAEGLTAAFAEAGIAIELTPIGWLITGLALVAWYSYEIYKHWDDIKEVVNDVVKSVEKLGFIQTIGTIVKDIAGGPSSFGMVAGDLIGKAGPLPGQDAGADGGVHLHYMEGASVQVQGGGSPQDTAAAVKHVLDGHAEDMNDKLAEHYRMKGRASFTDQAYQH